jgi:hypothetical protein
VHGRRGRCRVVVDGVERCGYIAHIVELRAGYLVWGDEIRCEA